jgi:membrane protease YdiL (CAAX protease family)
MTHFQEHAVLLIAVWLALVAVRYRRSTAVLTGGMFAVGSYAAVALIDHDVTLRELGLSSSASWWSTIGFAVGWLALMLAYSPVADRIATRWVAKPPNLGTFRALQRSTIKLLFGIVVAWILGGFLEEFIFRGILLQSIEAMASSRLAATFAAAIAIVVAALGAGVIHLYQGLRAAIIITQLSVLFGLLFVVSGHNLWAVILCHGLYDTIAFVRFATGKSRYSRLDREAGRTDRG